MVYQGPSRGCHSCRRRRKKCDETRPSCLRCVRAKLPCHGYEVDSAFTFRQRPPQLPVQSAPFVSIARKCGLPKRMPIAESGELPEDGLPPGVTQQDSDWIAFRALLYNYCVVPANGNLSSGYFADLEPLALRLGPNSSLVRACSAVSLASGGKVLRRPNLVRRADLLYHDVVRDISSALANRGPSYSRELELVVLLLGLYEMITSSSQKCGNHAVHFAGWAAISGIDPSFESFIIFYRPHMNAQVTARFALSGHHVDEKCLDTLLLDVYQLLQSWHSACLPRNSELAYRNALELDAQLVRWKDSVSPQAAPTVLSNRASNPSFRTAASTPSFWTNKTEIYLDLHVAGVWNVFRVARLLLHELILQSCERQSTIGQNEIGQHISEALSIAEEILASIPFHLLDTLQISVVNNVAHTQMEDIGRVLGGFLLLHPLYVVMQMSFLPHNMKSYCKECLEWINLEMGIGYAEVLANNPTLDIDFLISGFLLIWSGASQSAR
ncbi:uncharacterized protein PV09_05465 [Verruconis gallopava]|uniref:Zn(2)-C6 fungal-type domain-containing protein n=1 Tax=Verruconis gallopava TaxID=253628 RepID=A0A0D2AVQ9_9PEZI|nr:uncharacterized protein PV09_05465 [Verruconis gallopava]KIW03244.1 hypothetical protein PV09_05465 [Verruconis gallopava]